MRTRYANVTTVNCFHNRIKDIRNYLTQLNKQRSSFLFLSCTWVPLSIFFSLCCRRNSITIEVWERSCTWQHILKLEKGCRSGLQILTESKYDQHLNEKFLNLSAVLISLDWTYSTICILILNNFWQDSKHLQNCNLAIVFTLQIVETVKELFNRFSMLHGMKYKHRKSKTDLRQQLL